MSKILSLLTGLIGNFKFVKIPISVLKKALDGFLDPIEKHCKETPTKWDDVFILTPIQLIRKVMKITEENSSEYAD